MNVMTLRDAPQAQVVRMLSDVNEDPAAFRGHLGGALTAFDVNCDGMLDLSELQRVSGLVCCCCASGPCV